MRKARDGIIEAKGERGKDARKRRKIKNPAASPLGILHKRITKKFR
jgi:hypothetical protein